MKSQGLSVLVFAITSAFLCGRPSNAESLSSRPASLTTRIDLQLAINKARLTGASRDTTALDQVDLRSRAEADVLNFLKEKQVLTDVFHVTVSPQMLEDELNRIVRSTHSPDRLQAIFAALGHNTVLVKRYFVEPALVSRILRRKFASDPTVHSASRALAQRVLVAIRAGEEPPEEVKVETTTYVSDQDPSLNKSQVRIDQPTLDTMRERFATAKSTEIQESVNRFFVQSMIASDATSLTVHEFVVEKIPFRSWMDWTSPDFVDTQY